MTEKLELLHRGLLVEYASLAWGLIEGVVSVGAGLPVASLALIAFGVDSFIELGSSFVVADYLRLCCKKRKFEQNTKIERITAVLLLALIPTIGLGAFYSYLSGIKPEASPVGIAVACGAAVIMPVLWYKKKRIGKATNCLPLTVDAIESATCFLMSLALLVGLLVNYLWKLWWADYLAAAVILIFITKEAIETISENREISNLANN